MRGLLRRRTKWHDKMLLGVSHGAIFLLESERLRQQNGLVWSRSETRRNIMKDRPAVWMGESVVKLFLL